MAFETHIPVRQAQRLYKIGQFFLDTDPVAQQTGIAERVDSLRSTEDMKLPEIRHPKDEWEEELAASHAEANARADRMPTSIENTTTYSFRRGEGDEIRLISHARRVDLGYKIPVIEFDTGSENSDREAAAKFLMEKLRAIQGRTDQEKTEDTWNATIRSTLLADHVNEVILNPVAIQAGQIYFIFQDNITGLSSQIPIKIDMEENGDQEIGDLFYVQFNLLSKLQQLKFDAPPNIKVRIEEIVNDFLQN